MREHTKGFQINGILVLVLFGIFAISILAVLLTGAGAYRRLTERGQKEYTVRTIPQYMSTRVRQADVSGAVRIDYLDGVKVLALTEEINGTVYVTRIYCHDGYIRELFAEQSIVLEPSDGECIMEAEQMDISLENGVLDIRILAGGEETWIHLVLRSKEVAYEK